MARESKRPTIGVTLARLLATVGPAGYMPVAPGTAGTLAAVPVVWLLSGLSATWFAIVTIAVTGVAVVAAHVADRSWGQHDCQRIVIDEVAGYMVTLVAVPRANPWTLALGFLLFRVLDSFKPPGARWIDRKLPGGAGVVLDDVVAGLYGAVILWLVWRFGLRP